VVQEIGTETTETMDTIDTMAPYCVLYHRAVEIIGRRWTGPIVRVMLTGVSRFGAIRDAVPGLSDRLLSERLKELEAEGIVARHVTPTTPVLIEYRLTDKGRALAPVVGAIADWAEEWVVEEAPAAH
jgi:DNA-binding HxlR family transcriptional regulator